MSYRTVAMEDLETMWQPIETAPKDGRTILGWWVSRQCITPIYWVDDTWLEDGTEVNVDPPSHWMEIPEPPGWVPA